MSHIKPIRIKLRNLTLQARGYSVREDKKRVKYLEQPVLFLFVPLFIYPYFSVPSCELYI